MQTTVPVELKCGQEACIGRVIEQIMEISGKPHSFRDPDENRPLAPIQIRIETMRYILG
jgi:predicted nucleotide-binding protein (sugar kinase/HSP70/actin superfamily)